MINEKDHFSEIIKNRLEKVEVPYNESHWEEMSHKLYQAGSISKPSGSTLANKFFLGAAAAGILAFSGWYYLQSQSESEKIEQVSIIDDTEVPSNELNSQNLSTEAKDIAPLKEEESSEMTAQKSTEILEPASVSQPEEKVEKYVGYSEETRKEETKELVDKIVQEQKAAIPNDPKIDNPALKTNIEITSTALCQGDEIEFTVDKKINGTSYAWDFGDNDLTSRKQSPKHIFKKPGTYTVKLIVSKIGEEKNNYKAEKEVTISAAPVVKIVSEENDITLEYPYAKFKLESNMNCSAKWEFDNRNHADGINAEFLIPKKGNYTVEVSALANNGCSSTKSIAYTAEKGVELYVEDAFRPASSTNNHEFLPQELKVSDVPFTFMVRDLSGGVVFESTDKYNAWNGSLNNTGSVLPEGQYLWTLNFTDEKGMKHQQKGRITLLH